MREVILQELRFPCPSNRFLPTIDVIKLIMHVNMQSVWLGHKTCVPGRNVNPGGVYFSTHVDTQQFRVNSSEP
jgi:hypothetical protein